MEIAGTQPTQKGKRTFRKNLNTKVDLTPMVDLGFLLISFFVFTSTLAKSTVMEMVQTTDGEPQVVTASSSINIIGTRHNYYYYEGLPANAVNLKKVSLSELRSVIAAKKRISNAAELMFLLKFNNDACFSQMIDVYDEMQICAIPPGHFAETELLPAEIAQLK